jgi:hypothetical protein
MSLSGLLGLFAVLAGQNEDVGGVMEVGVLQGRRLNGFLYQKEKHFFSHFVETFVVNHALVNAFEYV